MTFGSSGMRTGMDNSNPEVQEGKGKRKKTFPKFGNGKGMKEKHSKSNKSKGTGRDEKIHSHILEMGIRGFRFWEWTGTGFLLTPAYRDV